MSQTPVDSLANSFVVEFKAVDRRNVEKFELVNYKESKNNSISKAIMKRTRLIRYKEKSDYIITAIESTPDDPKNDIEKSAAYYKLHTSIEAAMDIIAMLLKDLGKSVGDDYSNIITLEESRIVRPKLAEKLKKCNGLRNYLVHRYNGVDDEIVLDSVEEVGRTLRELLDVTGRKLDEIKED